MANYKLTQSKEQIQADLNLLDSNTATQGQVLTANGTGGASWQDATEVVANPVLAGTESDLTGLEVAGTKYKIPTGGAGGGTQLYLHKIVATIQNSGDVITDITVEFSLYLTNSNEITINDLRNYATNNFYVPGTVYGSTLDGQYYMLSIAIIEDKLAVTYLVNNVMEYVFIDIANVFSDTVTPL